MSKYHILWIMSTVKALNAKIKSQAMDAATRKKQNRIILFELFTRFCYNENSKSYDFCRPNISMCEYSSAWAL